MKTVEPPVCPICDEVMVASRMEAHDGSGFFFGWACLCNEETREDVDYDYTDSITINKERKH